MAQRTVVLKVSPAIADELRARLTAAGFEIRGVDHAFFGARGNGVTATLYRSGKLLVQGADPESFVALWVPEGATRATRPARASSAPRAEDGTEAETYVGSDESGKGDYFGPLVVAAVRLDADAARALRGGPVRDCKEMSDESVKRVGAALRAQLPCSVQRLDPPAYNAEHERVGNLNPMLAALHARAIGELAAPGMHVVVDQFAAEPLLRTALAPLGVRLEQRFRGEELLAVAAASVIARERFLAGLKRLSEEWAIDLAKGAGDPVEAAARRFVTLHGAAKLREVAKVHFRTTRKVAAPERKGP